MGVSNKEINKTFLELIKYKSKEEKKSDEQYSKNKRKLLSRYSSFLPPTLMGNTNYNKAVKTLSKHISKGEFPQARAYVKDQANKISQQVKGTGSEGYMNDLLRKLRLKKY